MKRLLLVLLPYALYSALCLPFSDRAYDIDDPIFLSMTRQIAVDPLRPLDFDIRWDGKISNAIQCANPPLPAYFWAAATAIGGESEVALHLGLLPFGWLALWATGRLARRFQAPPRWAQLLVAVSPALILASNTVMPDVMLLGFTAAGLALGIDALDQRRWKLLLAGGLLLGAAALIRYNGIGGLVLLLVYGVASRASLRMTAVATLVGFAVPVAWNVLSYVTVGKVHFFAAMQSATGGASPYELGVHALASLLILGGVAMAPPFLGTPWLGSPRYRTAAIVLTVVLSFTLTMSYAIGELENPAMIALYPLFLAPGLLFFAHCWQCVAQGLRGVRKHPNPGLDSMLLALWTLGMMAAPLTYVHVAAKYFVPALPAIILLFLRALPDTGRRGVHLLCVLTTATLSVFLAAADHERTEVIRTVAREVVAPRLHAGQKVWFLPEWGYYTYLGDLGAKPFVAGSPVEIGDMLVTTKIAPPAGYPRYLRHHLREVEYRAMTTSQPFVTMQPALNAGFHSQYWGWLPYSVGMPPNVLEEVRVYEFVSLPGDDDEPDGRFVSP